MKKAFILMVDFDGTTRSHTHPIGVAVSNEETAKEFVDKSSLGYFRGYKEITIIDDLDYIDKNYICRN